MWSVFAIVGLLSGEVESAPVGRSFESLKACSEYFSAHGTRVGLSAQGKFRKLKAGRQIIYIKIACGRLSP